MSEKIKLGIIGIGNMGSGHAHNIVRGECPEFELVAVADIKPQRIENTEKQIRGNTRDDTTVDQNATKLSGRIRGSGTFYVSRLSVL